MVKTKKFKENKKDHGTFKGLSLKKGSFLPSTINI
jgi:hypothetical protein